MGGFWREDYVSGIYRYSLPTAKLRGSSAIVKRLQGRSEQVPWLLTSMGFGVCWRLVAFLAFDFWWLYYGSWLLVVALG